MTASDFVNCSRTQSLVAQPDTSRTAAGISTPIFIICRISPSPLWTLANVWERMRSRLGEQQPRQPGRLPGPAPTGGLFQMRPLLGGRVVAGAGAGGLGLQALDSSRLHGPCNRYTPRPLAGLPWPPASLVDGGGHVDVELLLRRLGPQQRPGRPHL